MWNTAIWIVLACQDGAPRAPLQGSVGQPSPPAVSAQPDAAPGVLPPGASAEARALWERLVAATNSGGQRVTAFDLTFDGRARADAQQSNDFNKTRYRYMAPNYVRMTFEGGVEHMRGPEGDWLVDPSKGDVIALRGRDYAEDRKQLAETLSIGRNFVALTDPAQLRIQRLVTAKHAPNFLPNSLARAVEGLQWLEVDSPDFYLLQDESRRSLEAAPPVFRALLGLNPNTGLPAVALIYEMQQGGAMVHQTAVLVQLSDYRDLDGFRVPFRVATHAPDFTQNFFKFSEVANLELWLLPHGASLRPELTEATFLPATER